LVSTPKLCFAFVCQQDNSESYQQILMAFLERWD